MTISTPKRPIRIDPDQVELAPLSLDPKDFQSPLPVQKHHLIFEDEAIGLSVGIWDTSSMHEAFGPYPGDEFITVLDGSFSILDATGAAVAGHAGESATFRNAIPVSWKQDGYLRKVYLTLKDPAALPPAIESAAGGVTVLGGQPMVIGLGDKARVVFLNDTGTMAVENCVHKDSSWPAAPADMHELCRVLSGEMVLTDDDGHRHHFGPDDHVFIPKGTVVARKFTDGTEGYHVFVKA